MLGWESKYPLEEGLKETIEWYKNFLKEEKTCVINV
jgi:nucleoside-diphosphate-sugar epimerase